MELPGGAAWLGGSLLAGRPGFVPLGAGQDLRRRVQAHPRFPAEGGGSRGAGRLHPRWAGGWGRYFKPGATSSQRGTAERRPEEGGCFPGASSQQGWGVEFPHACKIDAQ